MALSASLLAELDRASTGRAKSSLLIALDESQDEDEGAPASLVERLAFRLRLPDVRPSELCPGADWRERIGAARVRFPSVTAPENITLAIVQAAATLGITSARADIVAVAAARAHAAWRGALEVDDNDAAVSVRLVLAHRARLAPVAPEAGQPDQPADPEVNSEQDEANNDENGRSDAEAPGRLEDRLVEAASAALPPGLLDGGRHATPRRSESLGRSRARHDREQQAKTGRPIGAIRGDPRRQGTLHLLATITAAAPWQILRRRRMVAGQVDEPDSRRLYVMPSDLRVTRYKRKSAALTIFGVDASGSAAMQRLSEAKGAVELLLAECYVRREEIALVAFRGRRADVLLAPTRALARAKRTLAQLPAGDATPLASGIDAAYDLAVAARRAGKASLVVLLTDGKANIDRNGRAGRKLAAEHAAAAARRIAGDGIPAILIDTSAVPGTRASELANAMKARYVVMPNAGAHEIAGVVAERRAAGQ
ncbi:MAG: VWA domain-containing protein [Proteobacteria bacterium]|nr:VWA domain-containing protein [Pseudomonadota bacterium]